ncbi:pyridoxal-phosphate-dependent aminotransferase family protein [Rubellimicrobium roseum]|uniref:Aminotransferase class V-fold PLP-dependent enzyme n=1 Tax=Rubellimicrobium roseum TaxID=687525 RepID=A0A5C4NJ37_9RHOB|nr:aminotransferase class V-fold PLP-dependent enzyme [Rubellimicrobium roseum]TNC73076.1 aminotransferase class V-fold PLP-dependent enzyme [Rubellimicrobium roseum]
MLAQGRSYLAIPGPSVVPDRVLRAMHRASPDIYEGEIVDLTATLIPSLRAVAATRHKAAIYIGNGHAAWEASLVNVLSRGDRVLVPLCGHFGRGWAGVAQGLGLEVETIDFGPSAPFDPARIEAALRADRDRRIKAVLAVHVDTSTSVRSDIAGARAALDAAGHPALLMADCVASLGCDRFEMDAWGADVTLAASQKGLMCPPGLAFLWFNDRAAQARARASLVTPYWDWVGRADPDAFWRHWFGTAPAQALYGLREALDMIEEEGLTNVWARHATLARAVWAAAEAWGQGGPLRLNVPDPQARSHAITALGLGEGQADALRRWTKATTGVTLGIGLGREPASAFFRIGHMGHVNAHMVLGALASLDAGLKALAIPHGDGALDAAARVVAGA